MRTPNGSRRALALSAALPLALLAPAIHAQDTDAAAGANSAQQQSQEPAPTGSPIEYPQPRKGLAERTLEDAAAYYTAPLRWNGRDWEYFGGALAAIAVAHHYDTQARTHFERGSAS